MAANSSTSSSSTTPASGRPVQFGAPWGLIGAMILVIVVELTLRAIGPMKLIAFASDEGQYHAVRDIIDAEGPSEVALVGSSQMREGVSMPLLMPELARLMDRRVWAANYALRGARVDAYDALVRYLQRQPHPPKLIVVGLSPRDLRADGPDWPRLAIFWNAGDWWREFRNHRGPAMSVLPVVVRSEIGRACWTLRYREEISLWLRRPLERFGVDASEEENPILGEETSQHHGSRGLVTYSKTKIPLHRFFDRIKDSYLPDRPAPPKDLIKRLDDLGTDMASGQAALWVEMPNAPPLHDWLQLQKIGQQSQFDAAIAKAMRKTSIGYFSASSVAPPLAAEQFRDLQHLNRLGAEQFSHWLAEKIAAALKSK